MAAPQRVVDKDAAGLCGRHERLAEPTVRHALRAVYQLRRFAKTQNGRKLNPN
jgi:hypothetical protein